MPDVVFIGLSMVAFSAMLVLGLMIQHSVRQARHALTELVLELRAFRHELAEANARLDRLEHMAHWPETQER
jgi:hypothetical protein